MSIVSDILVMRGLVSEDQVHESRSRYGDNRSMEKDLVRRGFITEAQFAETLAKSLDLPYMVIADLEIPKETVDLIPDIIIRKHQILPLREKGDVLEIAMVEPNNLIAIDDVTSITGKTLEIVVVAQDDMETTMNRYVRSDSELVDLSHSIREDLTGETGNEVMVSDADDDNEEPIIRFVNLMITQAIQDRASDIHVEPQADGLRIRYRIDGVLHEVQKAPKSIQDAIISRLKIVANVNIAEKRIPQDGRTTVLHNGKNIDLRVATLPTVWGENVVLRILYDTATTISLKDMYMSDHNYEIFRKSFTKPHGMILVTGPTGSGKSTTLYTTLNAISTPEVKVITVEDPVEFRLAGVNQVQVNPRAGMTFAAALKSILRSDPDIVLVGEIRDGETATTAIEASLTGHLVLSTLHTNNAPSAVTRLIEMGVEPFLVGSALECVVAQRLARKLCEKCKQGYTESEEYLEKIGIPVTTETQLFRPVGCSSCSNTGYRGRIAIHEIMHVSETIEKMAVDHVSSMDIEKQAIEENMTTLRMDGWNKVAAGYTSIKEVLRVVA